jgi:hypothetical protein
MKKLALLIVPSILLSGCVMERMAQNDKFRQKVCSACAGRDTVMLTRTDSVVRLQVDTLVVTERDTASIYIRLGCDSIGNVYVKNMKSQQGRIISLSADLRDNILRLEAMKGREQSLVRRVRELEKRLTSEYEKEKSVIYVPEPFIPWWLYPLIPFALIGAATVIKWILPIIRRLLIGI